VPAALTLVQLGYAGYFLLCKAALSNGANRLVFAVYRDIIALLILGPLAYFSERYIFLSPFGQHGSSCSWFLQDVHEILPL
jgi:hypothetical protein